MIIACREKGWMAPRAAENFTKPRRVTLESGLDSGTPTALSQIVPETMQ